MSKIPTFKLQWVLYLISFLLQKSFCFCSRWNCPKPPNCPFRQISYIFIIASLELKIFVFKSSFKQQSLEHILVEIDISLSKLLGFETFADFWGFRFRCQKIWSQKISFGFGKFGIQKKYQFWFQKKLVSEKSISFSFGKFGLGKKSWFRFQKNLVLEKSLSFGKFGLGKEKSK